MTVHFHAGLDIEQFFLEWMGHVAGRELGTNTKHEFGSFPETPSHRKFTSNPKDILAFVRWCETTHEKGEYCRPCWISAQPTRRYGMPFGIEKLFFDFDDDSLKCPSCQAYWKKTELGKKKACPKCQVKCVSAPRLDVVGVEVKKFLRSLKGEVMPFVARTHKGYHVYLFLRQVFEFKPKNTEFAKRVYRKLQEMHITGEGNGFMDERIIGDLTRLARVPLTKHEKTGEPCVVVNESLEPTKVRHVEYFRIYGVPDSKVEKAVGLVQKEIFLEAQKKRKKAKTAGKDFTNGLASSNFTGIIRPCFAERLEKGFMTHDQRLALLNEAYFSGYRTEDQLVDLFRNMADFSDKITRYQVRYFLKRDPEKYPPYRCRTLTQKGWCIEKGCPIFMRRRRR